MADLPVLLDEWQAVPDVLGSVKRAVDDHDGAGRYLLTGSVRGELLESSWAATGRIVRVALWGLSQRELVGDVDAPSFFDEVLDRDPDRLPATPDAVDLRSYVERAMRSGFPDVVLQPSATARTRWLGSYVDALPGRDAAVADEDRDPVKLRRYLRAVAASTAGVVEHKTLFDAAGITRATATRYDSLLELLFVTQQVPACQLRPEVEASTRQPVLHHLRHDNGNHEIDLVAETPDGRIVAIDIKTTAAPRLDDARHLIRLRDAMGDRFHAGIVFHTGPSPIHLNSQITALPIASIWSR